MPTQTVYNIKYTRLGSGKVGETAKSKASDIEQSVQSLMDAGFDAQEIAADLQLPPFNVEAIMQKLSVRGMRGGDHEVEGIEEEDAEDEG